LTKAEGYWGNFENPMNSSNERSKPGEGALRKRSRVGIIIENLGTERKGKLDVILCPQSNPTDEKKKREPPPTNPSKVFKQKKN